MYNRDHMNALLTQCITFKCFPGPRVLHLAAATDAKIGTIRPEDGACCMRDASWRLRLHKYEFLDCLSSALEVEHFVDSPKNASALMGTSHSTRSTSIITVVDDSC